MYFAGFEWEQVPSVFCVISEGFLRIFKTGAYTKFSEQFGGLILALTVHDGAKLIRGVLQIAKTLYGLVDDLKTQGEHRKGLSELNERAQ